MRQNAMTDSAIQQTIQQVKQRYEIIGFSPLLDRAIFTAVKVAATDISVLVSGESGVGKEAFSKIIHYLSPRRHEQFIAINGGALPEGTIDSELFGHEKGAFTSAFDTRRGYFETANGGTLFLDEIGEVPLETQSRLLRVLEYGEFIKVGSSKVQKTDVRLVAATNRDLLDQVQKGKFREDLYYRLNTVNIKIPPLRDRQEDIPLLFAKFSSDFADKYNVPPLELAPEAEHLLKQFSFPGNIRQLKNIVEQISILESHRRLDAETLRNYLPEEPQRGLSRTIQTGSGEGPRQQEHYSEREILYKFILDIKRDLSELKSAVYTILHAEGVGDPTYTGSHRDEAHHAPRYQNESPPQEMRRLLNAAPDDTTARPSAPHPGDISGYPDHRPTVESSYTETAASTDEEESLSLQERERELIKKALDRYQGKRKAAARELGISERTLYRKIKEFDLD
mgnify:CR=1 FL=1